MQRHSFQALLAITLGALVMSETLSAAQSTKPVVVPPEISAAVREKLAPHPRIFLKSNDEADLKRRIEADPQLKALWPMLLADADRTLTLPAIERRMEGRRLLGTSREVLRRVLALGVAHWVTKERKYFDGARAALLAAAGFSDWNPSHYLDVAEMTAALGIGYDWFYSDLSEADRATIRIALLDKSLKLSFAENHGWITATNNWNQVCHGGTIIGALALADEEPELAAKVIARAVENLPSSMKHYAPDGNYPEGPMYWSYGTSYNVMLIAALESALGTDFGIASAPGFMRSADYFLHVTGPTGKFFNYADCREGGGFAPSAPLFWMATKRNDPSLLFYERKSIERALATGTARADKETARVAPLLFLWARAADPVAKPAATHFVGHGANPVALHRSSWDDDATFIGIKGGAPSVSHGHMDVGAFVLDSQGVRWASDLGMQEYHSLESIGVNLWNGPQGGVRWQVFRLNQHSHNILTVGGQEQVVSGFAPIVRSTQDFTIVETSAAYAGQLASSRRGIVLNADRSVRLQDEIAAPDKEAPVRWAMLTEAGVEIGADGGAAVLKKDGKQLTLRVVSPAGVKLKIYPSDPPPREYDARNPGTRMIGFELALPAGRSQTIVVDFVPTAAAAPQPVRSLETW